MKVAYINKPYEIRIDEKELPYCLQDEALLKIVSIGICGSDLNSFRGRNPYLAYPRIPGHEIVAKIISLPDAYDGGLRSGDIVTCVPYFNCGSCYACQKGNVNCCEHNETMGVQRDGAMQEYISMPVDRLIPCNGLSIESAVLIEPFCIAWHGVKKARVKKGDKVLVIGSGTIGVLSAISARLSGAVVYISDIAEEKLEFALSNTWVDGVISNKNQKEFLKKVTEYTEGRGFDVVVEAAGVPSAFVSGINASAYAATMVQIGISPDNVDFMSSLIQKKELKIVGSRNALTCDFKEVVELMKTKKIGLEHLISKRFPFEGCEKAFQFLNENSSRLFKVVVDFCR